ncbi:hypothetical protein D3C73_1570820 [compost metagenome]
MQARSGVVDGDPGVCYSQRDQPDVAAFSHLQRLAHLAVQPHGLTGAVVEIGDDGAIVPKRIVADQIPAAGIDG